MSKPRNKIINDPVHGFITIQEPILCQIIDHPYYQRLRRIEQLGLTHLVYPGAVHSRFQHAIGAMFLMDEAIKALQQKGHSISSEERLAAKIAILLHDIGHGPYSHALEHSILHQVSHEYVSLEFIKKLNRRFKGQLDMAIAIFQGQYHKKFLSQLVSGQLDVDRLDYLRRDSFYTGVSEGVIGVQRILKMLDIVNDSLVVEEKGIYSIDNFLNARRIMYWQVYLHKTVLSAEFLLIHILKRAKEMSLDGEQLFATPPLRFFLQNNIGKQDLEYDDDVLEHFANLDDFDILSSIKVWQNSSCPILSKLSKRLVNRKLLKIKLQDEPFDEEIIQQHLDDLKIHNTEVIDHHDYFVFTGKSENHFYDFSKNNINILMKNGRIKDISEVSEQWKNASGKFFSEKHFLCYPEY